jgi:hypothetical protein
VGVILNGRPPIKTPVTRLQNGGAAVDGWGREMKEAVPA